MLRECFDQDEECYIDRRQKWQRRDDIKCEVSWVECWIQFAQHHIKNNGMWYSCCSHAHKLSRLLGIRRLMWEIAVMCVFFAYIAAAACVALSAIKILRSTIHSLTLCVSVCIGQTNPLIQMHTLSVYSVECTQCLSFSFFLMQLLLLCVITTHFSAYAFISHGHLIN